MLRRSWLACCVASLFAFVIGCGDSNNSPAPVANNSSPAGNASTKATPAKAGGKRLVFLTNGDDPFWDTCNAGFQEGAKQFDLAGAGLTADFQKNNGKPEGQIEKLRQYATETDIAGVAISVIQADNVGIANEMKKLRAAGIKVVTVDGDVNREKYRDARAYYLGTDNYTGGKTLGTAAKQLLAERGKEKGGYVQFAGFRDNDNARSRMNGFKDAIGEAFTELDRMPDEMKRDKARDNVRLAIDNFENNDLVALVGIWAYNAPAIAGVVSERKARDKYTVATFDAAQAAITEMGNGNIDVMVVQNPFEMGQLSIKLLKAMVTGDEATEKEMFTKDPSDENADIYTTGLRVVVPDEKSPVKADAFDPNMVEFMTLPQFKEWLDKYGLKSS